MEPSRGARAREKAGDALVAVVGTFGDELRHVVMHRLTRPKYEEAERLAMEVLDNRLGAVTARTKPGAKPTQQDSQTIDLLKEIRSEMQTAFDERWHNRERPVAE